MSIDFAGTAAIVTGGAKGIGRGICTGFAQAGANVLCADVDEAAGTELAATAFDASVRFVFSGPTSHNGRIARRW